jgi:uncharacterized protein
MFSRRAGYLFIFIFTILVIVSLFGVKHLTFDYNFESFFPKHSKELDIYYQFRDYFEPDDNFIMVVLENDGRTVFEKEFLLKVDSFTKEANTAIPHIQKAYSPTNVYRPLIVAGTFGKVPVLHVSQPEKLKSDSIKLQNDPRFYGRFIAQDSKSLAVILKTTGILGHKASAELQEALDQLVRHYGFVGYHIIGRSYFQSIFGKLAKREFVIYTLVSAVFVTFVLVLIFKKPAGVFIALVSVLFGMILFIGFLSWMHTELDPLGNLFPVLLLIVGISDVIHIMTKYISEQRKGLGKTEAIRVTFKEIGLATFLTSLTTAIGFLTLTTSSIPPIRKFGLFAAVGVFIAYITVLLFTTALISLFDSRHIIKQSPGKNLWQKWMDKLFVISIKKQKTIMISGMVVVLVSLYGISMITTNAHLINNFPRFDKTRIDFKFIEKHYGGFRSLEMGIYPQGGYHIFDEDVMQGVDQLEQYLGSVPTFYSPVSPVTFIKSINRGLHLDKGGFYTFPESEKEYKKVLKYLDKAPGHAINVLVNKKENVGRLSVKTKDLGSDNSHQLRLEIDNWVKNNLDSNVVKVRMTGTSLLFDKNSDYVRQNIFLGLGLALLAISLLMALVFKNWRMVFISLIPNMVPLLIGGAVIGYFQIELDAATSIIFAISFGIVVDDTIHFLSKFKLEQLKGHSVKESVRITFLESGKAICITSIILFIGFSVLITSSYPATFYIGILIAVTLSSALIADLMLTPVLLYHFYKGK